MCTPRLLRGIVLLAAAAVPALVPGAAARAQRPDSGGGPPIGIGPNLRVAAGAYNEMWVAVSQANPDLMVAVAQEGDISSTGPRNCITLVSRDRGRTWAPVRLPGYTPGAFDPMVAAGPDGRIYVIQGIIGGSFARAVGGAEASQAPAIRVWSTTGDAWTWEGPTEIRPSVQPDHMRLVVDMTDGPHRGRVYIAWNDVYDSFVRDQYAVFLQYSDDHGKTFNDPMLMDMRPAGKLVATEPVVLSDGTVLMTYYQYWNPLADPRNDKLPMFVRRSTDGARTFSPPDQVFDFGPHVWAGRRGEFASAFSLPIVVADTSSKSSHRDNVYIAWDDVRSGWSDIWLARSTDKGRTWSKPVRVNDNERGSPLGVADYRMTPVVAVAPDGTVGVAWYDRRGDPARRCWDLWFSVSTDGGRRFAGNRKVSTAQSCPPPGQPPGVYVHNLSPHDDPNRPPDSTFQRMATMERFAVAGPEAIRLARLEANKGLANGRIVVSFDPGRNVFAGHYTGLAADRDGGFTAMWADRRNGKQDLYAAHLTLGPAPATPGNLVEADVTDRIEVVTGTAVYDSAKGTVRLPVQVRNVSRQPIYGPIRLDIVDVWKAAGQPSAELADSAGAGAAARAISFAGKLGSSEALPPRGVSEAVELVLRLRPGAGFDTALDFRVKGRVAR